MINCSSWRVFWFWVVSMSCLLAFWADKNSYYCLAFCKISCGWVTLCCLIASYNSFVLLFCLFAFLKHKATLCTSPYAEVFWNICLFPSDHGSAASVKSSSSVSSHGWYFLHRVQAWACSHPGITPPQPLAPAALGRRAVLALLAWAASVGMLVSPTSC